VSQPLLDLIDVSKTYGGLRPLRIARLTVEPGERIALAGLDGPAAEVFVNLVTGATLPDSGEIIVFGRSTREVVDSAEWLAVVDRFGLVSERTALLEGLSVVQNLALPFTLEIEPVPADVRERTIALAREVGLPAGTWDRPAGELDRTGRARARLARALALGPAVLLVEHPAASVDADLLPPFLQTVYETCSRHSVTSVVMTATDQGGHKTATRTLALDPASGRVLDRRGWWGRWRSG
jgi:ABC-type transporter Mla maintaining outer membrane lipid asymmetry ATPase subunit MlaF